MSNYNIFYNFVSSNSSIINKIWANLLFSLHFFRNYHYNNLFHYIKLKPIVFFSTKTRSFTINLSPLWSKMNYNRYIYDQLVFVSDSPYTPSETYKEFGNSIYNDFNLYKGRSNYAELLQSKHHKLTQQVFYYLCSVGAKPTDILFYHLYYL